ncbi:tetratricopeptide repeat protein [Nocardioides sp. zg-1308]|uniref:tetratricopeptide repeat protein n=1 Tax=Nocardioides TaxID=1839 RepID=UPI0015524C40|nr:tetratricopeptide repeat protein [Nocardioides sp. S-34]NPD03079.1 tetratricopeptide repeat protein [Nocardioides sp. zg-1308]WQQ20976.1 tetratricopeptide repeat protein [Nocardioides sp. S-34]
MTEDWQALMRAETLLDLRRDAEAEQRFRDVLAADPESVPALLGLGRALNRQDRHEEAERAVRSALALAPEHAAGYHQLTDVLCDRRDGAGALSAAESGLALAPHAFTSHYQHARALLSQRRPRVRDAYDAAVRAVGLAPHSPDAHNLVGLCLDGLGDHAGAQAAFRNALALDPLHTMAQNNLAATELDRGRLRRAAGLLRSAVGNDPQEKQLHQNLDVVLLLLVRRVVWSLCGVAIVLGVLLVTEAPWWARALSGTAYVAVLATLLHRVRVQLPRGVSRWGRGIWGRTRWQGRYLIGLLVLLSVAVLLLAFAPYPVAAGAGLVLGGILRVLGVLCVIGWIGAAAVNLARGR